MGLTGTLREHEAIWRARPLLRRLYGDWHDRLLRELSAVEGPIVELGAGFAPLKRRLPALVATDVEETPWAEAVVDAQDLPYADTSVANYVLFDVLHHLARPDRFLDEAARTLKPGGRVVMVEPYASPLSTRIFRRFHHERTDLSVDPFVGDEAVATGAMEGNQALPTLLFFRHAAETRRRWPELRIVRRARFSFVLYPLSGGFSRRPLVPAALYRPGRALELLLAPLAPLAAFRCLVVLERVSTQSSQSSSTSSE